MQNRLNYLSQSEEKVAKKQKLLEKQAQEMMLARGRHYKNL
jgi:hypothetical protein